MSMFWILCLLVGSITCSPVHKGNVKEATLLGYWLYYGLQGFQSAAAEVNSNAGGLFPKPSQPYQRSDEVDTPISGSHTGYSSTNMAGGSELNSGYTGLRKPYYSPVSSNFGVDVASYSSGYAGSAPSGTSAGGFGARPHSGSVAASQDEAGNSGSSNGETAEQVFSDVSDLEPIYSFSSRSRYQRGRAVFAQTRYIPGEPAPPLMPVSSDVSKKSVQSGSEAPATGGF
uniref:Uncharacterized protein n=1 Tax=Echeneis naucrates TaxID=173247 RepID=A0A665UMU4_ECHNA